jgi:predicted enzyme related to lactoylglutathione lyase
MHAKYEHTNLIARDWQSLAKFYIDVFGCIVVPPERDFQGEALEHGTGLEGAHLSGLHLRLPGCGEDGPTLEIFTYHQLESALKPAVNRPGFGHIAFEVDLVENARQAVISNGGNTIGEIVTLTTSIGTKVTWCYVTDPEGNIIELQTWSK